jgi:hypothetical protein
MHTVIDAPLSASTSRFDKLHTHADPEIAFKSFVDGTPEGAMHYWPRLKYIEYVSDAKSRGQHYIVCSLYARNSSVLTMIPTFDLIIKCRYRV